MTASPPARVVLFGVPQLRRGDAEVAITVRKTLALAIYLAVEGPTPRGKLAELLWGDLDEATARRNLRRALHRLRGAGLGDVLSADDETVAWVGVETDLQVFERLQRAGDAAAAIALRGGAFCEGLVLDDAESFDEWLRQRRERFLRDWQALAARHATDREAAGDLGAALAMHRLLLADDPLREATYRDLMRLHDALDQRGVALELFERCARMLREELQLEPLPETRLLAERIRGVDGAGAARPSASPLPGPPSTSDRPARGSRAPTGLALDSLPLVARERELAAIDVAAAAVILVEGEAGVGKSRLAREAASRLRPAGEGAAPPLVVRFTEMSASTPFHAVVDALRGRAAAGGLDRLGETYRHDLAFFLPGLLPEAPAAAAPPSAEARSRLLEALAHALAEAVGGAGVVVFDDLHWADASSAELLLHLARRRVQAPAAMARVLATARGEELAGNAGASVALQSIAREGQLARVPLSGFDEWSMLQLVQRLSGGAGGVRFAARLAAATGGNAFFALETIRALFEAGELRVDPEQCWSTRYDETTVDYAEMPLPASVIEAVRARLVRLGPAAQRVLETAALADDGCTLAELQGATALSEWEALEAIERAIAAQFIERAGAGYRFVHALVRGAVRSALSPERRRLMHAKLATAIEPLRASPARVADHWQRAGETEKAAEAWGRAGDAATALHAYREAFDHWGRAVALTADAARAFEWQDLRVFRVMCSGWDDERGVELPKLLAIAERTGAEGAMFRALLRAAENEGVTRQWQACETFVMRALREYRPPDAARHMAALSVAAYVASEQVDRGADALARWNDILALAERSEPGKVAWAASAGVTAAVHCDRLDEAEDLRRRALRALEAIPETTSIQRMQTLSSCIDVPRARGDRRAALDELERAMAMSRRLHESMHLQSQLANHCELLIDDGLLEPAAAALAACASLEQVVPAFTRYLLAMLETPLRAARGELGAAVDCARNAVAAADALGGAAGDQRDARMQYAALLSHIGAAAEAERVAEEALAVEPLPPDRPLLPRENLRAAAWLATDPEGAAAALHRAMERPMADRLLHPHLASARILIGRCELAAGRPQAARDAVRGLRYSVAAEAEALAVRLEAARRDGADGGEIDEARAMLDAGRVPPLAALELLRALVAAGRGRQASPWRTRLEATAQGLADSLRGHPALQAAFIRRHRDLLT